MRTVQFETVVNDNVISIPVKYRSKIRSGARVKVFASVSDDNNENPKTKAGALTANDFIALRIDTRSFVFNREYANERR